MPVGGVVVEGRGNKWLLVRMLASNKSTLLVGIMASPALGAEVEESRHGNGL